MQKWSPFVCDYGLSFHDLWCFLCFEIISDAEVIVKNLCMLTAKIFLWGEEGGE